VKKIFLISCILASLHGCLNPFAPAWTDTDESFTLGDQTTISGFFQCFAYAYNMRDTVVYGQLLAEDFIFLYTDHEKGMDFSWTREEDMHATYKLFNGVQNLDFVWNEINMQSGSDTSQVITRSFDLTICIDPTDIPRATGKVIFHLKRSNPTAKWMLTYWKDESLYS